MPLFFLNGGSRCNSFCPIRHSLFPFLKEFQTQFHWCSIKTVQSITIWLMCTTQHLQNKPGMITIWRGTWRVSTQGRSMIAYSNQLYYRLTKLKHLLCTSGSIDQTHLWASPTSLLRSVCFGFDYYHTSLYCIMYMIKPGFLFLYFLEFIKITYIVLPPFRNKRYTRL